MTKQFLTPILLPADPVAAMEAATKQYVDTHSGGGSEVEISTSDPIGTNPLAELWYDSDAPNPTPGFGIPSGGVAGQVLTKQSSTDYAAMWAAASGVPIFATEAARDAALPGAANGTLAITTDKNRMWMRIGGAWGLIAGSMPYFWGWSAGTQTCPQNVATTAVWAGGEVDTDNCFNNATGVFTCPAGFAGRWRFDYTCRFQTSSGGLRNTWLELQNGSRYAQVLCPPYPANVTIISGSTDIVVAAGNTIVVKMFVDVAGGLTVNQTTDEAFKGRYVGPG